jgi:hypothetical protein
MKYKFILGLMGIGLIFAFLQQIIDLSKPTISQLYEKKHHLRLRIMSVPARGYANDTSSNLKHFLYFESDSSSAKTALDNLIFTGFFADSLEKREVFLLSDETLNIFIKDFDPQKSSMLNKVRLIPIFEGIYKLSYYYKVNVCSFDFDVVVDSLPKKSVEFLKPY